MLLLVALPTQAAEVAKDRLRALEIAYANVIVANDYPGPSVLAEVRSLPGDRFTLRLPFSPNRITPLVAQGDLVTEGQAIAQVSGPELAAWLLHAEAVAARFAMAEQRFSENQSLYQQQALSAAIWSQITENYYDLRDQMHHVEHTLEVLGVDGSQDTARLLTPRSGSVNFTDLSATRQGEFDAAHITEPGSLRLTGLLSQRDISDPIAIASNDCRAPVSRIEAQASALSRRFWSEPVSGCVSVRPGALIEVEPLFAFTGYAVPRSALVSVSGNTGVFVDTGPTLEFIDVTVVAEDRALFYINSSAQLRDGRVLVTSTSAVQGMLLGLGVD